MKFGICTSLDNAAAAKAAGWDYVEENVQNILQGSLPDEEWQGEARSKSSALPIIAANVLVPGSLKITGPDADISKLRDYMSRIVPRAAKVGIKTLVFGSGGARNVPEGFDRHSAEQQIAQFAKMSAGIVANHGITITIEPLHKRECNIVNTVAEAMTYVRAVNHPNFQCLVDSYHFWLEDEPLKNLEEAMPWIKHVHVADKDGRTPPGESGTADYRPFFAVLKRGKYNGPVSVEANGFSDIASVGPRVLEFIKRQWSEA